MKLYSPLLFLVLSLRLPLYAQIPDIPLEFVQAAVPTFVAFDFPGSLATRGYGINDAGQIVGSYEGTDGSTHGFFLSQQGAFRSMDVNLAVFTASFGINIYGDIVGTAVPEVQVGFRFSQGHYRLFDTGEINGATGINRSREIVGYFAEVCCKLHGYLIHGNKGINFNYPGASSTSAIGINDDGSIVGIWSDASSVRHGFLLETKIFTSIDMPGAAETLATGINLSKTIVGTYVDASGVDHGFLLQGSTFNTVDFPGATSTDVSGINNLGIVVGNYTDANGTHHGFFGHL